MKALNKQTALNLLRENDKESAAYLFELIESKDRFKQFTGLCKLRDIFQFEYYECITTPPAIIKSSFEIILVLSAKIGELSKELSQALYTRVFIDILKEDVTPYREAVKLNSIFEELAFIEKVKIDLSNEIEQYRREHSTERDPDTNEPRPREYWGTPFRIESEYEHILNAISEEIENKISSPQAMNSPGDKLNWEQDQEIFSELIGTLVYSGCFKGIKRNSAGIMQVVEILNNVFDPPFNPGSVKTQFSRQFKKDLPFTTKLKMFIDEARKETKENYKEKKRPYQSPKKKL